MTARSRMAGGWALRVVVLGLLAAGCGDDAPVAEPTDTERETSGGETTRPRGEQPQITGLMGTIQREQVERAMRPRLSRLQRCFSARMGDVELLAGDIRLEFRIRTDGSVLWVYPQQSTIGDRATEQCILEVASQVRFSRPRGGEAEFSWGFGLESGAERPPLSWTEDALGSLADELPELATECGVGGPMQVTAYVQPGGGVLAAGGTMPDAESAGALDCVLEGVRAWQMRDPGSYPAKITFGVR